MARQKALMQNITSVPAATPTSQAGTDVLRVGNNRSGVVFLDVYSASGATNTMLIQTSAEPVNGSSTPSSPDVWITLATFPNFTGATSMKIAITDLGDCIRWRAAAVGGGALTFRLITFLCDQP